jgi:hypothetical protein
MRDRIYIIASRRVRVCHAGAGHGVQRWVLEIVAERTTGLSSTGGLGGPHPAPDSTSGGPGGPHPGSDLKLPSGPPQRPTGGPPEKTMENQSAGGPGWPGGPLSPLRVRAHTCVIGEPGKGPPTPLGPPSPGNPRVSGGGPRGGLQNGGPPGSDGGWEELI